MPDLAFILVRSAVYPDPERVIACGRELGLKMKATGSDPLSFEVEGVGQLVAMLMPAPHPDVPSMPSGPTSPDPEEAERAPAHFVVIAQGLSGEPRHRDTQLALFAATIVETTDSVAAMLGHGRLFHKAEFFKGMARLAVNEGVLPAELAVDVTGARQSATHMSFLTHGMTRYGREELYVTCPIAGKGALGFVLMLVRWMLADLEKKFPTGDTIGRTADEKIRIERVASPIKGNPDVIALDLPQ
jgi:hypothetical protein